MEARQLISILTLNRAFKKYLADSDQDVFIPRLLGFYSMEVIQYQKECLCLTYDLVNRQALAHKCDFCTNNNPKYQIFGIVKNSQSSFCKTTS